MKSLSLAGKTTKNTWSSSGISPIPVKEFPSSLKKGKEFTREGDEGITYSLHFCIGYDSVIATSPFTKYYSKWCIFFADEKTWTGSANVSPSTILLGKTTWQLMEYQNFVDFIGEVFSYRGELISDSSHSLMNSYVAKPLAMSGRKEYRKNCANTRWFWGIGPPLPYSERN